jgi:hypothetical protein
VLAYASWPKRAALLDVTSSADERNKTPCKCASGSLKQSASRMHRIRALPALRAEQQRSFSALQLDKPAPAWACLGQLHVRTVPCKVQCLETGRQATCHQVFLIHDAGSALVDIVSRTLAAD